MSLRTYKNKTDNNSGKTLNTIQVACPLFQLKSSLLHYHNNVFVDLIQLPNLACKMGCAHV